MGVLAALLEASGGNNSTVLGLRHCWMPLTVSAALKKVDGGKRQHCFRLSSLLDAFNSAGGTVYGLGGDPLEEVAMSWEVDGGGKEEEI